jgi:hypothetical protein
MSNVPPPAVDNGRRRLVTVPTYGDTGVSLAKFLVVWMCSAAMNGGLLLVGFLIASLFGLASAGEVDQPEPAVTAEVEDADKQPDLTNTDLGLDDKVQLNYNVDRIEEVSVPGKVDPNAAVGIDKAPEAAPTNIPLPPGSGGGTGAAPMMADAGAGAMYGTLGGMGGLYTAGGFGGRSGATRKKMLTEGGGNALSEAAVARGLRFLALHQAQDGRWTLNDFNRHYRTAPYPGGKVQPYQNAMVGTARRNDVAATAFALLPFLAAGQTHKPPKEKQQHDYHKGIQAGLRWLINKQSKSSGDRGFFGGDMYSHGLATIAMCEAYGLTSDPMLKSSAQLAINYIITAQDATGGGWRYAPRTPGDTSVTGWQLMALKSGQMSGLTVPKAVLKKVEKYLDSCESGSSPGNRGGYGYMPATPETPTMTAVGALCRQYLGVNPRNPSLLGSVAKIKSVPPGAGNIYYEYYATQVMHHMGGEAWNFWNLGPKGTGKGGIRDTLIAKQHQGQGGRSQLAGSFAAGDHVGGRLGGTSLSLLTLEVYYRHLPLYRRDLGVMKDK